MRRLNASFLASWLLVGAGCSAAGRTSPRVPDEARSLVGTWRLVSYEDWDASGKRTTQYGESPRGYFVYDATGHVSVHIMKTPPLPPEGFGHRAKPTSEQKAAAFDAYVGYFGTYTVDAAKSVVVHHVEGSLDPSYTDTDQPRPFQLSGDTLVIGDQTTWKRVLVRVRPQASVK
jgi:hypothetical protein